MLTFGVQTERLRKRLFPCPLRIAWLYLARVSSDTALKIRYTSSSSNEAAMPTGSGKTVTLSLLASPCNASLHQLNFFMPSRGIASDTSHISMAFSSSVSLPIRSFARSSDVSEGFWKGYCCPHRAEANARPRIIIIILFIFCSYLFLSIRPDRSPAVQGHVGKAAG
jgi:hypothetical protein